MRIKIQQQESILSLEIPSWISTNRFDSPDGNVHRALPFWKFVLKEQFPDTLVRCDYKLGSAIIDYELHFLHKKNSHIISLQNIEWNIIVFCTN